MHSMTSIDAHSQQIQQHQHQIRRLEERAKYGCDENHYQKQQVTQNNRLEQKLKVLEERVDNHDKRPPSQFRSEGVCFEDLKAVEKKVKKYFNRKIDGLE